MLAAPGPVPAGPGWAFEFKWDGMRAVCTVGGGRVRVYSRNMREVTGAFPELAELGTLLGGRDAVLDGEIIAPDNGGRPSFALLQQRMHVRTPTPALLDAVPVRYHVFDILRLDGSSTTGLPYRRRREILAGLDLSGAIVDVPPHLVDVDGERVLAAARAYDLEGVVAKRLESTYQPGRRSAGWVKTPLTRTQEVTIIGYTAGSGRRTGTIGSLLLAVPDAAGHLGYAGHVGTGFTEAALRRLHERLRPLHRTDPAVPDVPREFARHARWVDPVLVGEVVFRTWTPDGVMRHTSWRGLRPDLPAPWQGAARRPGATPRVAIDGTMRTTDGRWQVQAVRQGHDRWYRITHGDNVVDGLSMPDVERLLARAGVDLSSLHEVPAA